MTKFSEYNRLFISIVDGDHPFKSQTISLFCCNGVYNDKPIYTQYKITTLGYLIEYQKFTTNIYSNCDEMCLDYYSNTCQELDKTFESTFWIMWENVGIMNQMTDVLNRTIQNMSKKS